MNLAAAIQEVELRERRVKLAQELYPALFDRIRILCDGASDSVDVDHHAACVVLSANRKQAK